MTQMSNDWGFSIVRQVPMTQEKLTPRPERMIEDMPIHGMGDKARKAHIGAIKDFAGCLKRSPNTATPDDLRFISST
jgi:integrase/recombinase XerD